MTATRPTTLHANTDIFFLTLFMIIRYYVFLIRFIGISLFLSTSVMQLSCLLSPCLPFR